MTRFIFVRHGETSHNVTPVLSSAVPGPPINSHGREQVRQLAYALRGIRVDALYCSNLLRARQTADILNVSWNLVPVVTPGLRECEVGDLEGHSNPLAFARYHAVWDEWLMGRSLDDPLASGGETGTAVLARMRDVLDRTCELHAERTAVLVSHGGFLRLTLSSLLSNVTPEWAQPIPNAGMIVVVRGADASRCETWCGTVPPSDAEPKT